MVPSVVYEDKNILAVNKPSGLVVHSDGKTKEPTLVEWLSKNFPDLIGVGEMWKTNNGDVLDRSGIVHRLDRETSGVLIVARNQETFKHIKSLFQNRKVSKTYNAFVYGSPKPERGIIERKIGRSRKDFRLWSAQRGALGELRTAVTEYQVLKGNKEVSYIRVSPQTGRTHQVRVHMKAIHHPVVCDKRYAPKRGCLLGFRRLALHATNLSFVDQDGKKLTIETSLPDDFVRALEKL